jgi:flagellar hook-associated protein 3 FlgL
MSLRVNPNPAPDLIAAIANNREAQNTALQQLSTGREVVQISDNPAAAAQIVLNHGEVSRDGQYLQNISDLSARLGSIDSSLSSVVQALTQAISLGTEGANGTLSDADRQSVAQEMIGIRDQVLSLANQSYQGSYVFAGTAASTQPFVLDSTQPNGVRYDGNGNSNEITISRGNTIPISVPGDQIFTNPAGDVLGALNGMITALQTNSGLDTANLNLQQAFSELSSRRVFYGNTLARLESTQTFLNSDKARLAQQENDLTGADLASSITNLQQASTATDAILSAAGQILSTLHLFDFLK